MKSRVVVRTRAITVAVEWKKTEVEGGTATVVAKEKVAVALAVEVAGLSDGLFPFQRFDCYRSQGTRIGTGLAFERKELESSVSSSTRRAIPPPLRAEMCVLWTLTEPAPSSTKWPCR